jgi:hypothetical protein
LVFFVIVTEWCIGCLRITTMSFYASITNQNESPSRRNAGLEYRLHWNLHRKRHYSCRSIVKRKNSTNININRTLKKRHMALEIQVLAWDRHNSGGRLTGFRLLLPVKYCKIKIQIFTVKTNIKLIKLMNSCTVCNL